MTDSSNLATVTVTYNPNLAVLETQLRALPEACARIIVDNASRSDLIDGIKAIATKFPGSRVICNDENLGLAVALNKGAEVAASTSASVRFVLLLDQDSEPQPNSVERLLEGFERLERAGRRVGCVGPSLIDPETGLTHGFHQCTSWRWKRVRPAMGSIDPIACANLNGSGTLLPVSLFRELGGLEEELFIDHVDTEWSFRVLVAGYELWGIPDAVFLHRMGNESRRFWLFGWRVWPSRSPHRHYFLFRNAVRLMGRPYIPLVWKLWAVAKLVLTASVTSLVGPQRCRQVASFWHGIRDGRPCQRSNKGVL